MAGNDLAVIVTFKNRDPGQKPWMNVDLGAASAALSGPVHDEIQGM
ncbi:hypothetical protein [Mycobacteroides abscessus]|nr:hypothetical protein [Mycobacteroides abscessus]